MQFNGQLDVETANFMDWLGVNSELVCVRDFSGNPVIPFYYVIKIDPELVLNEDDSRYFGGAKGTIGPGMVAVKVREGGKLQFKIYREKDFLDRYMPSI